MKTLEKGSDKIQKICAVLRDETLEPAQKEARAIIEKAEKQAEQIVKEAQKAANKLHVEAKAGLEQEYAVFQASLHQAAKQSLESLRQSVENKFFNDNLAATLEKSSGDPALVAALINAIAKALEKEGLNANLTAIVPKTIAPKQLNDLLLHEVLKSLKEGSVVVGNFAGGAKVRLNNKKVTIDISEEALKDLLGTYIVRKDFRKLVFG